MDLKGKIVWITGASSGIGEEFVKQLSKQGVSGIILTARNKEKLDLLASTISIDCLVLTTDLSVPFDTQSLVQKAIDKFGRIDILINNAGVSQRATALETNLEIDRKIMELNYFSVIHLSKEVMKVMLPLGGCMLVTMSSLSGLFGFSLRSAYSASKHALHGFFESVHAEYAKQGIHTLLVCPGRVNTPISLNALKGDGAAHGKIDEGQKNGVPVDVCVSKIIRAMKAEKHRLVIAQKERILLFIHKFIPTLFYKIVQTLKSH